MYNFLTIIRISSSSDGLNILTGNHRPNYGDGHSLPNTKKAA